MSNPYLSFIASLGGPTGSHSTLKKLASTPTPTASSSPSSSSASANTTTTFSTTITTNLGAAATAKGTSVSRHSSTTTSRSLHASYSSSSSRSSNTRPSSHSSSSSPYLPSHSTSHSSGNGASYRKHPSSSSSSWNHDRAHSKPHSRDHNRNNHYNDHRPSFDDVKSSNSKSRDTYRHHENDSRYYGSHSNMRRDHSKDRSGGYSSAHGGSRSDVKHDRSHDRDVDESQHAIESHVNGGGGKSSSMVVTNGGGHTQSNNNSNVRKDHGSRSKKYDSAFVDARARKRHAGSRSQSRSRSRGRGRDKNRSRSTSRSKSRSMSRSRSRSRSRDRSRSRSRMRRRARRTLSRSRSRSRSASLRRKNGSGSKSRGPSTSPDRNKRKTKRGSSPQTSALQQLQQQNHPQQQEQHKEEQRQEEQQKSSLQQEQLTSSQAVAVPPPPPRPRTPSPRPPLMSYHDMDDASSFSTLSSPASFSPSLSPRSMPSSPKKELTPIKKRRIENIVDMDVDMDIEPFSPSSTSPYSSRSSLSSLSPDRSHCESSADRESGLSTFHTTSNNTTALTTASLTTAAASVESSKAKNIVQNGKKTKASVDPPAVQRSLEMELFGVASQPSRKTSENSTDKKQQPERKRGVSTKKTSTGVKTGALTGANKDEEDDEEYISLGSDMKGRPAPDMASSKPKHPISKPRAEVKTREIVMINTLKGTVTFSKAPVMDNTSKASRSNSRPSSSVKSSGSFSKEARTKEERATTTTTATPIAVNGSSSATAAVVSGSAGSRRMSILHSDQIVAAAMNRYKNHFHMIVEDSDSTVASNPSSTGADTMHIALEYPGKDAREKFTLMKPFLSRSKTESDDKDEYNPIEDLVSTVKSIMEYFFSADRSKELFGTSTEGLYRNLTKFKNRKDGAQFLKTVEEFNQLMKSEKSLGRIQNHLAGYGHKLPYELVVHILQQVYSRTVAARASKLNQYEAFSNNVYGEILPILTREFIQRTKLNERKVFVDLGCGIGNVVLQVALQTGAESYGVEIMETPAKFSKKQAKEFEARSRAYGLHHGPVTMIQGDFLETPGLPAILARADVVLVNNYAFNSALNQSLLQLFLDLKEGCKIISLKTFVSLDHKINVRNAGSVESILRVKKYPYYTNAVSWTHNGGEYYIATVDRSAVQAFWERAMANGGVGDDGGRRASTRRR